MLNNKLLFFFLLISIFSIVLGLIVFQLRPPGEQKAPTLVPQQSPTSEQKVTRNVSPLIFGTNLHLDHDDDKFVTNQGFRDGLKVAHTQMIRMPIREVGGINPREVAAAKYIKQIGMVPLIILKFHQDNPADAAKKVITEMNAIFGNDVVYYEFGNEVDLAFGTDAQEYTTKWNQVIPQIKSLPLYGQFGGPTNYQYNPQYISYFVKNVHPKPDFISWHEYTCDSSEPEQNCLDNVLKWSNHIKLTKEAIQQNGNVVPPIMISEWNYAPDGNVYKDDKHTDAAFITELTKRAIQVMADNNIFAAHHYDVTSALPIADKNGNLTIQGQAFAEQYNALIRK